MRIVVLACLVVACGGNVGDSCDNLSDCKNRRCVNGTCQAGVRGESCVHSYDCDYNNGIDCFGGKCVGEGMEGEPCGLSDKCDPGLRCHERTCRTEAQIETLIAADKAAREKAQRDRVAAEQAAEARMLAESGVAPGSAAPAAEKPAALPPGPGARVRVVEVKSMGTGFAACRADERLTSGGCRTSAMGASYPSHHGTEDTVGARWNCTSHGHHEVVAFALCIPLR